MKNNISHKTRKILVIDDDLVILNSIKKQLKNEKLNPEFVNNPLDGIRKIKHKKYDLIISDLKMKPITGVELLKQIRSIHPNIPVIILTGYVDDNIMKEIKNLNVSDFLIKPIRKKDLINSIYRRLRG